MSPCRSKISSARSAAAAALVLDAVILSSCSLVDFSNSSADSSKDSRTASCSSAYSCASFFDRPSKALRPLNTEIKVVTAVITNPIGFALRAALNACCAAVAIEVCPESIPSNAVFRLICVLLNVWAAAWVCSAVVAAWVTCALSLSALIFFCSAMTCASTASELAFAATAFACSAVAPDRIASFCSFMASTYFCCAFRPACSASILASVAFTESSFTFTAASSAAAAAFCFDPYFSRRELYFFIVSAASFAALRNCVVLVRTLSMTFSATNCVTKAPTETATRSMFSDKRLNKGATVDAVPLITLLIALKALATVSFNLLRFEDNVPSPADCIPSSIAVIMFANPVTIAV